MLFGNLGISRSPLNALKENKETVYLSYQLAKMKAFWNGEGKEMRDLVDNLKQG